MPEATVQMNTSQRILHDGPTLIQTEIIPVQGRGCEGDEWYSPLMLAFTTLIGVTALFFISLNVLFLSIVVLVHTIRLNITYLNLRICTADNSSTGAKADFQTHFQGEIREGTLSTRYHGSQSSIAQTISSASQSPIAKTHGISVSPKPARGTPPQNFKPSELWFTCSSLIHLPRALCQSRHPSSAIHSTDILWCRLSAIHLRRPPRDRKLARIQHLAGRPARNPETQPN
ncbi:hypothetical protein V502_09426 [Pseudogymnoascus sp. VKM F-4520 (FW-2644)]|nr:hypothetical protein V502_09426 [Pseudogymnoascus sp. VKM F-4520 (FW-2644)]